MTEPLTGTKVFEFVGGDPCLDFVNTVGGSREGVPRENLHAYGDLLSWAAQAHLISDQDRKSLEAFAIRDRLRSAEVLGRAIKLREAVYQTLYRLITQKPADERDLATINLELATALAHAKLVAEQKTFTWGWDARVSDLDLPLWPVVRSAAELLSNSDQLPLVRHCHGEGCGWLFLDQTKNHSRRWCVMKDCGNRAKVRRHRAKQRDLS